MYVWWGTRTECLSALVRRAREKGSMSDDIGFSRLVLISLAQTWTELGPSESIRDRADLLLEVHALKAADAFQLAAALEWGQGFIPDREFVSLDRRLRDAANREGFLVVPKDL